MMDQMEQVVSRLKNIGWTKSEAECYCSLVEIGPAKASKIARETDRRKAKIYNPLNSLEEKGFINITDENPNIYMAQNPRHVIKVENDRMKERSEKILENLQEAWEIQEDINERGGFEKILKGREGRDTEIQNFLEKTQDKLLGMDLGIIGISRTTSQSMKKTAEGLDMKIIGGPKSDHLLKKLQEKGVQTRKLSGTSRTSYYVGDDKYVLMNIRKREVTMSLKDEEIARVFTEDFENLFKKAESLNGND